MKNKTMSASGLKKGAAINGTSPNISAAVIGSVGRRIFLSRSLSFRTMMLVLGSIAVFSIVLSGILFFGIGYLLSSWHERESAQLHVFIQTQLEQLARDSIAQRFIPSENDVRRVLDGVPHNPSWIVVTRTDGTLLYYYADAGSLPQMRGSGSQGRSMIRRMQDIRSWHTVYADGSAAVFRYSTEIPSFNEQESNRILLAASRIVLTAGFVFSALFSFFAAFFFSRPMRRQADMLSSALSSIAAGRRDIVIPGCSVYEFNTIAQAADTLQKNLAHEELLRRQWAADSAHDLRTPVTVLRGQLEGIYDGVFAPDKERIGRLLDETAHLESLVNALSVLTKIETPGFIPQREKIDTASFARDIASRFFEQAREVGKTIEAVTDKTDAADVFIDGDRSLLERAVSNLAVNALQYGETGTAVYIRVSPSSISVENTGLINRADRSHVFDRLYRADSSRSTQGSGLGLAIVKAAAEAHGWKVSLECDEDSNKTTFSISFT